MGGPCPIYHLSQSPVRTPAHHHFLSPDRICAFPALTALGPQLVPLQSLSCLVVHKLWGFSLLLSYFHTMNQNLIIFQFSDMFDSFQPMYSAEGGWTDSDLDLVVWETSINMCISVFPAFVKLCFMPVLKSTLSSCAWPETVNINVIADHFHKNRCLLSLFSNFHVAPQWLLGCCLPNY